MKTKTLLQIRSTNSEYRILRIPNNQIKKFLLLNSSILLFFCSFVLLSLPAVAQAPESFKYQAALRDNGGTIIANQAVDIRITISNSSIAVYQESHTTTTNPYGLVGLNVGSGTVLLGVFANISWGSDEHFIQVEMNTGGGYVNMGTTQLLSVPYALHAKTVESVTENDPVYSSSPAAGISSGNITNWNTAYGWGNHATAGYLTSFTETDPLYSASPASGITGTNITNWNNAYGWGNHSTAGYLTSFSETDPTWSGAANQTGDIGRTGNVGIGTNNPNARLEISGSGPQSLRIHSSSSPGDVSIDFLRAGTTFYDWRIRNTGGDLRFSWSADDLATVNDMFCLKHSTGRVGIGTNMPTAQLHTTGTVRFAGAGTPGTGKVLTSDAQGNATWEPLRYQVGDFAYGGVVIYVEPCGTKGLVCAIENRAAIEWGTSYTLNARAEGIYGGKINTTIIVSVYAAHSEFFQIAARSGMNYNYGGYGDWYLPAKDELNLIHQNYLTINAVSIANGGEAIHSNELYWSSTEYDNGMAWVQRLTSTGAQFATSKSMIRNIRPIRAF